MAGSPHECVVRTGTPSVVVAVAHHVLRPLIVELLTRDQDGWRLRAVADEPGVAEALAAEEPDLIILDDGDLARFCRGSLHSYPRQRIIVIGYEPDPAYERAARREGAGAWLFCDRVGDDLSRCMRTVLARTHHPVPHRAA